MNQTFEGIVLHGEIRQRGNVGLPENTRVYVVVPDATESAAAHIRAPRLAHSEQASEFKMEVLDEVQDAGVGRNFVRSACARGACHRAIHDPRCIDRQRLPADRHGRGRIISFLPAFYIRSLVDVDEFSGQWELQAFDGTRSVATSVRLEVHFLGKVFRGQFLIVE